MRDYMALLKAGTDPPLFSHIYITSLNKVPNSYWQLVYFPGYGDKDNYRDCKHESITANTPEECLEMFSSLANQCPACVDSKYTLEKYGHCGDRIATAFTGK